MKNRTDQSNNQLENADLPIKIEGLQELSKIECVLFPFAEKQINFKENLPEPAIDISQDKEISLSHIVTKLEFFNDLMDEISENPEQFVRNLEEGHSNMEAKTLQLNQDIELIPSQLNTKTKDFNIVSLEITGEKPKDTLKVGEKESESSIKSISNELIESELLQEELKEKITEDEEIYNNEEKYLADSAKDLIIYQNFQDQGESQNQNRKNDQDVREDIKSILESSKLSELTSMEQIYEIVEEHHIEKQLNEENEKIKIDGENFEDYFKIENDQFIALAPKKATEIYEDFAEIVPDRKITDQLKVHLENIKPAENKIIVQLEPRELGKLQIEVNFENNQLENIKIEVAELRAFDLIQNEKTDLRNLLSNLGFQLVEDKLNLSLNDKGGENQNNSKKNKGQKLVENLRDITEKIRGFIHDPYGNSVNIVA